MERGHHPRTLCEGGREILLKVGRVNEHCETKGAGRSIWDIALESDVLRIKMRQRPKVPDTLVSELNPYPDGSSETQSAKPSLTFIDHLDTEALRATNILQAAT